MEKEERGEGEREVEEKKPDVEGVGSGREAERETPREEVGRGNKSELGDKEDDAESRGPPPGTRNWSPPELAKGGGG